MAATVLDCIAATGQRFAILHGEADVAGGHVTSDVDIVAARSARDLLRATVDRLHDSGLHPVVVWPYGVGSASVFIVNADASDGAQFDIVHDEMGQGHYGFRTGTVLHESVPGRRWMRARGEHELLYVLRKRLYKAQYDRVADILTAIAPAQRSTLLDDVGDLFVAPSATVVARALAEGAVPTDGTRGGRATLANMRRVIGRIARPVGFWVMIDGAEAREMARRVTARFENVLPASGLGPSPGAAGGGVRELANVAAVRWRAGLYCSWGPAGGVFRPDLALCIRSLDPAAVSARIVGAMERRLAL